MPAVLADFDGTVCPTDVGNAVCARFADGDWRALDDDAYAGRVSLRDAIDAQTRMLRASRAEMVDYVLERFAVDPTFPALVRRARDAGAQVTVVSDGLGFYVRPMLDAAGLGDVPVLANARRGHRGRPAPCATRTRTGGAWGAAPARRRRCCAHARARGGRRSSATAMTDRYGALFADVVFAKGRLAELCSLCRRPLRALDRLRRRGGRAGGGSRRPRPSHAGSGHRGVPRLEPGTRRPSREARGERGARHASPRGSATAIAARS